MRYIVIILFALVSLCRAEDIYIAQNSAGGDTGTDCANAHSLAWLNTAGNWAAGAGTVSAGDTVHLCGTLTNTLTVQASGTAGNKITILFESGAKFSKPAWTTGGAIYCYVKNYITIDGGANGLIENTDNGTSLGSQAATVGIVISGSDYLEIKNLTITNLYVRTSTTDVSVDSDTCNGIYGGGPGSHIDIHNCNFSGASYLINLQTAYAGCAAVNIYSNMFTDCNIGINWGVASFTVVGDIYNNSFSEYDGWDDTTGGNRYHHNGLHLYGTATSVMTVHFYNNIFSGAAGQYCTSQLAYYEVDNADSKTTACKVYNNVSLAPSDNYGNFAAIAFGGAGTSETNRCYNNTIVGNSHADFRGLLVSVGAGNTTDFQNNVLKNCGSGVFFYNIAPAVTFDYNLYTGCTAIGNKGGTNYTALATWQTVISGEAQGIKNDTGLINANGTLAAGSPAIGTASDQSAYFTTDKNGATRSTWDIGAYKYTASNRKRTAARMLDVLKE